jgi:hypothetical protein
VPRPPSPPPGESHERQVIVGGTVSTVPFAGCSSTDDVPAFQLSILGGTFTVGVGSDDSTVLHNLSESATAAGSGATIEPGDFVEVVGTVADSCILADRIVKRSEGNVIVRGNITSSVPISGGIQIVVQGLTFNVDSNTRIHTFRGRRGTIADLTVGTLAGVAGRHVSGSTYQAKRIRFGSDFVIEGPITAVGPGATTITVANRVINVPDDAEIIERSEHQVPERRGPAGPPGGPPPSRQPQRGDVSLLRVGVVVAVNGQAEDGPPISYTADRIFVYGSRRVTFEGVVLNVVARTFTLQILEGVAIPVNAERARGVRGRLTEGITAVVSGEINEQGVLVAVSVFVKSRVQFTPRGPLGPGGPPGRGPEAGPPGPPGRGPEPGLPGRGPGDRDRDRGPGGLGPR